MRRARSLRHAGFTLVEAVLVIVLVGILSTIVMVFIRGPVQGYADSVARAELTETADLAVRRMGRDLRLALPNSIRPNANGDMIEFLATKGGGRYLADDDGSGGDVLSFMDEVDKKFVVVGAMSSLSANVANGDYVVVNNFGTDFDEQNAYRFGVAAKRNIAQVTPEFSGGTVVAMTMGDNPFARADPPMPSSSHRFQVVSGPVMYRCASDGGVLTLFRHWNYGINENLTVPSGGKTAVLARHLHDCKDLFTYTENTGGGRAGLVVITLQLRTRNDTARAVKLVYQVHVDNTP